jgi:hypothetical protein
LPLAPTTTTRIASGYPWPPCLHIATSELQSRSARDIRMPFVRV